MNVIIHDVSITLKAHPRNRHATNHTPWLAKGGAVGCMAVHAAFSEVPFEMRDNFKSLDVYGWARYEAKLGISLQPK